MRSIVAASVLGALVVVGIVFLQPSIDGSSAPTVPTLGTKSAGAETRGVQADDGPTDDEAASPETSDFDRTRRSTSDPASIWVVVNKTHPIVSDDYRPEIALVRGYQIAKPIAKPLTRLLADSDEQDLGFKIASAFRSNDYQASVYADVVAARGKAAADEVSARPGHSEHQTGLAVDLVTPGSPGCDFEACFAETPGGQWLADNAWRYGFIVRYQPGSEDVTGYSAEPWHLRYVGKALAAELRDTGVSTLEEFFGIPGGDYAKR